MGIKDLNTFSTSNNPFHGFTTNKVDFYQLIHAYVFIKSIQLRPDLCIQLKFERVLRFVF